MTFKEKDFIEINFTGRVKDGDIFDSNIKADLEKANIKGNPKPFVFCLGEGMFIKGVDKFLIGKDTGKYSIELKPEDAFGKRDPKLIQMVPIKVFIEHQINPIPGAMFNFDGKIAKVLTVSGGRVMVDFNNPISGKEVIYDVDVIKKVDDKKIQIAALNDFFFRQELDFEVKDKDLIFKVKKEMKSFIELFKDKYKEIFGLEVKVAPESVTSEKSEVEGEKVSEEKK